jgi:hypothetical protein
LDNVPNIIHGFVQALRNNNRLLHLAITNTVISDAHWTILCHSLAGNSTLQYLLLLRTFPSHYSTQTDRIQGFVDMLEHNTVLRKVYTHGDENGPPDEFERSLSVVIHPILLRRARTIAPALVDICSNFFFPADAQPDGGEGG